MAEGFITIAVENMANAIKKISVQRGYDVTEYLLNCFGGAGGQHACLVADALGMEAVLIHPFSGLLSAYGIGLSSVFASRQQALIQPLAETSVPAMSRLIGELAAAVLKELGEQGIGEGDTTLRPILHIRYDGTDTALPVPLQGEGIGRARRDFEEAHKAQFGFIYDDKPMIIEAIAVEGVDRRRHGRDEEDRPLAPGAAEAGDSRRIFCEGRWQAAGIHRRAGLTPGQLYRRAGPHHRKPPDDRGRARLAGGDHRQGPCAAAPPVQEAAPGGARN